MISQPCTLEPISASPSLPPPRVPPSWSYAIVEEGRENTIERSSAVGKMERWKDVKKDDEVERGGGGDPQLSEGCRS